MPKLSLNPVPKLRFHGGQWRIYWKFKSRQYSLPTGCINKDSSLSAQNDRRLVSAALAMDDPDFPEKYADDPAVLEYLKARGAGLTQDANWLASYEPELRREVIASWATTSMTILKNLDTAMKGIQNTTPESLSRYLTDISAKWKNTTRNKARNHISRFFRWAVRTKRTKVNPVVGIKQLPENRSADIVYCSPKEVLHIIDLAIGTGLPEWTAVPIAFYGGLRRGEVVKLKWEDVHLNTGNFVVRNTKTKRDRTVPISTSLDEYFRLTPPGQRYGYVVNIPDGFDRAVRLLTLTRIMQKAQRKIVMGRNQIRRPNPSKSKEYKERRAAYDKARANLKLILKRNTEIIGWNSFRHTFASVKVQNGVSIQKVAAWLGNTIDVCQLHYARFIPKDKRDTDIDKGE